MKEKFTKHPKDETKEIIYENEITLEGIETLYQKWSKEGYIAESLVFHIGDIENISDEELINMLSHSGLLKSPIKQVIVRQPDLSECIFINFNYQY